MGVLTSVPDARPCAVSWSRPGAETWSQWQQTSPAAAGSSPVLGRGTVLDFPSLWLAVRFDFVFVKPFLCCQFRKAQTAGHLCQKPVNT